jgi:hypothetical protein
MPVKIGAVFASLLSKMLFPKLLNRNRERHLLPLNLRAHRPPHPGTAARRLPPNVWAHGDSEWLNGNQTHP